MRESFRIGLLKFLAFLSINIYIYSAAVVLRSVIFKDDGGVGSMALYAVVLLAGAWILRVLQNDDRSVYKWMAETPAFKMLSFTFNITEKTRFIASVAVYTSLILPLLTTYLVFRHMGLFRTAFETMVILLPYLVLTKHRYSTFSRIMNSGNSKFGFFILIAAVEISILIDRVIQLKPYLFLAAYAYMFFFLIIKNQEDIDDNIYDRKNIEKSILPRNLRSFNTLAIVVLYSMILLLFNLKPLVLWLMNLAGRLTILFAKFLLWLSGLFLSKTENPGGQNPQQPDFGLFGAGGGDIHPFIDFVFSITKYFIILYLLYRLVLFVLRRVPSIARRIIGFLRRLFSWNKQMDTRELLDYDDESEIVKPQRDGDRRHSMRTLIKKAGRGLETITDPVERVRFIYASILEMLGTYGIPTEKSDTTLEILKKSLLIRGMDKPLNEVTYVYNGVRYGSHIPGRDTLLETEAKYLEAVALVKRRGDTK